MILADKIIKQRHRLGLSQEELAERMRVSRQAVSKWEAAQSTPDLSKILELASLFGVTTDYLLRDEIEDEAFSDSDYLSEGRKISLSDASDYLDLRRRSGILIAIATFICIISVIPIILLPVLSEFGVIGLPSDTVSAACVLFIFPMVAAAVVIYLYVGFKAKPYEYLESGEFEYEYGVVGMVKDRREAYRTKHLIINSVAAGVCVMSPVPLLIGAFSNNAVLTTALLAVTLIVVGIGVMLFIITGVRWASMDRLLGDGDYSPSEIKKSRRIEAVETVFWLVALAVYLGWSFISEDWHISWIIWPIAGLLSGLIPVIFNAASRDSSESSDSDGEKK